MRIRQTLIIHYADKDLKTHVFEYSVDGIVTQTTIEEAIRDEANRLMAADSAIKEIEKGETSIIIIKE